MNRFPYQITNTLREHRKAIGLSQQKVAAALGIKDNTLISRWERGAALPSLVSAYRLMELYRATFEELFPKV